MEIAAPRTFAVSILIAAAALALGACAAPRGGTVAPAPPRPPAPSMAQLLDAAPADQWRPLRPEDTLQLELPDGRVVIELSPEFAPAHAANLRALARGGSFDGLAVVRSFEALVEARRSRRDAWYLAPAGRIDLCNVPLPVRPAPAR